MRSRTFGLIIMLMKLGIIWRTHTASGGSALERLLTAARPRTSARASAWASLGLTYGRILTIGWHARISAALRTISRTGQGPNILLVQFNKGASLETPR